MSAAVARVSDVLRVDSWVAWWVALIGFFGVVVVVVLATLMGVLPIAVVMVGVALLALVSLRWPLLSLAVFVALIPIEEVVVIEGLGTLSRVAGILFAVTYAAPRLGRLAFGAMPRAAWAFLAWAVVSLGWAIDPRAAWAELSTLFQLFLIAVLVADVVVHQPTMVRRLLWVYSLSAAATALVGIQSFVALGSAAAPGSAADLRAAAIANQNPAQFAAVLLPAFVFGLYEVLNRRERILGGIVALLTTAGVVVSGTRGAWVSVAVVVFLFTLPRLRPRRQIAAIAAVFVLVFVTYQLPGVADLVAQRTSTALTTGGAGRTDIWSVAITIYDSAPLLGVGYANFPAAYTRAAVVASDVSFLNLQGLGPHNLVVGTLVELGPIGLLLLALFLLPLVLRRGYGPDAATIQAALASLLTLALFLDILSNRKQVWLVIGLAAGLALTRRKGRTALPDGHPGTPGANAGLTKNPGTHLCRQDDPERAGQLA